MSRSKITRLNLRWGMLFFPLLAVLAGCTSAPYGNTKISDAFPDPKVAALVEAVAAGDIAGADRQLTAGANINAVGPSGISPLLWVMGTTLDAGMIEYMLKAGANPNYRDPKSGTTAMYLVAGGNRPDLLRLLLKYKGNPSLPGPQGEIPLDTAVSQMREKNIKILMEHGAAMHYSKPNSYSVATTAARLGRFDLAVYFLEHGLDHNLDGLAISVYTRAVNNQEQPNKDKVVEMLKARGVKYPPDWPRKQ